MSLKLAMSIISTVTRTTYRRQVGRQGMSALSGSHKSQPTSSESSTKPRSRRPSTPPPQAHVRTVSCYASHTLPRLLPAASSTAFTFCRAWWVWAARPPSASRAGDDPGTMPTDPDTNTMPLALMACHG
jgi:hypothetical protein